jgi:hypothetical protein
MEIKILGMKIRPVIVVLCIVVGMIIGCFALCSCSKITLQQVKEGFEELGASRTYNMSEGVPGSYGNSNLQSITQKLNTNQGPKLPLAAGELFFFANNEFKPECCLPPFSSVSSADGCACVTKEQVDYINSRGGNRSNGSVF